jgi:hypothetical protein
MDYLSVDCLVIYVFLFITLVIGLRTGRGIQTIREYAVANKQFGTVALTLTFLATNIAGASVFDTVAIIADDGIISTAALLALVFTLSFIALFIAPHAAKFHDGRPGGSLLWLWQPAHCWVSGATDFALHCHHGVECAGGGGAYSVGLA